MLSGMDKIKDFKFLKGSHVEKGLCLLYFSKEGITRNNACKFKGGKYKFDERKREND